MRSPSTKHVKDNRMHALICFARWYFATLPFASICAWHLRCMPNTNNVNVASGVARKILK